MLGQAICHLRYSIKLLIISLLLIGSAPAPAQNLGDLFGSNNENQQLPVPDPARLRQGWWRYFSSPEPGAALNERVEKALTQLHAQLEQLPDERSDASAAIVDQIKQTLRAYAEEMALPPPLVPASALETKENYSLEELFDLSQQLGELRTSLQRGEQALEEQRLELEADRRALDTQLQEYLQLAEGTPERAYQGLLLMLERARYELQDERLEARAEELDAQQRALDQAKDRLVLARRRLDVENLDVSSYQQTATELEGRIEQLSSALERLREQLAATAGDDPVDQARSRYLEQRIRELRAQRMDLRLQRLKARGSMALGGSADIDIEPILLATRETITDFDEELPVLRDASEQLLLEVATAPAQSSRQVRELNKEAAESAQQTLKALQAIEADIAQLELTVDVLEDLLIESGNWWSSTWVRLEQSTSEAIRKTRGFMQRSLFRLGDTPITALGIFRVLLILFVAWMISFFLRHGLDRIGRRGSSMNLSSLYALGRLLHYAILFGALLIGLSSIGLDFSSLALIFGALSVGIGFGLQSIVNNFVSGLILLFERALRVGDFVELESGVSGVVREINMRTTRINTNDNLDVLVPNSEFVSGRVVNWTLRDSTARMHIPFGVAYGSDKNTVCTAACEAADKVDFTIRDVRGKEPEVWLVEFGDSSLNFELLVWVTRRGVSRPQRAVARYLWEIETALREHGIEIPFPQRDLHLRSGFLQPGESNS